MIEFNLFKLWNLRSNSFGLSTDKLKLYKIHKSWNELQHELKTTKRNTPKKRRK